MQFWRAYAPVVSTPAAAVPTAVPTAANAVEFHAPVYTGMQ